MHTDGRIEQVFFGRERKKNRRKNERKNNIRKPQAKQPIGCCIQAYTSFIYICIKYIIDEYNKCVFRTNKIDKMRKLNDDSNSNI